MILSDHGLHDPGLQAATLAEYAIADCPPLECATLDYYKAPRRGAQRLSIQAVSDKIK